MEYSALHKFFNTINYISQATKWNYFEVSTHVPTSAGSILDISKYRDTCERSISIVGGIAILRYIE